MPFIPHSEADVRAMLAAIGVNQIEDLFDEIPLELKARALERVPEGLSEMHVTRLMHARAAQDDGVLNFAGAGAYEHHIPAAVWQIVTRGEFYSAYTPYQAEASQGTLQVLYEYQTMMARLTAMEVSNASLYDGASALAEASLMAVRANRRSNSQRILVPRSVHPHYRGAALSIAGNQGLLFEEVPLSLASGCTASAALERYEGEDITALVIQQPNVFGRLEDVDALTDWAHARNALVVAVVNPIALALLKPPGHWGSRGADIVVGDGQPLGIPLSSGGPYFGFMTTRMAHVRQMPGRIVGRTVDADGRQGFTLTLQAREQHIRRAKATSNICTNQGLMVTAATIHLSLLGAEGLRRAAMAAHAHTRELTGALCGLAGVRQRFPHPVFHEAVIGFDQPVAPLLEQLAARGILGGWDLGEHYPELGPALLVCATETKTREDIERYRGALEECLREARAA